MPPVPPAPDPAQLLLQVADRSPDAIFTKDRQGRYTTFNREACRLVGRPADAVIGHDDTAIFPPAQAEIVRCNDERVMALDRPETFEELVDVAGGPQTFLATKGPLHDAQGRVVGMYGISRNISELVAARRALESNERRYRVLFKASPLPAWVYDTETLRVLAVNDAALRMYGYSREEFLAMSILDIRPVEEHERLRRSLAEAPPVLPWGAPPGRGWTHLLRDGTRIEVDSASCAIEFDGRPARLIQFHDVTQQRRLEREREAAHRELQEAFDRMLDGVVSMDRAWRYTFVNRQAATMYGRASPADLIGRDVWTEFPEAVAYRPIVEEVMATQRPRVLESFNDVLGRWYENRLYPSPEGLTSYFSDITERKEASLALQASERYWRGLFEQLADAVLVHGRDLRVVDANAAARRLLRHGEDGLIGRHLPELLAADQHARLEAVMRQIEGGATHRGEWRYLRADGQGFPAEVSAGRLDEMRFLVVLRDASERHRAEQALLRHQDALSELNHRLLDQERAINRRVAQSLHDRLGQTLAVARLHLDAALTTAGDGGADALRRQCERLSPLLDQAVREVRQVLVELRPPLLEAQGLSAALDNELRAVAGAVHDVTTGLDVSPGAATQRWPDDVEYAAFMIAREALANAMRHAGGTWVRVHLSGDDRELVLQVLDDGVGYETDAHDERPGHLGIVGMRERALDVHARLEIGRREGGGTRVSLVWKEAGP